MPHFLVIAEFIDAVNGHRIYPGNTIEISDDHRAERLKQAGVIGNEEITAETVEIVETAEVIKTAEITESVNSSRSPGRPRRK